MVITKETLVTQNHIDMLNVFNVFFYVLTYLQIHLYIFFIFFIFHTCFVSHENNTTKSNYTIDKHTYAYILLNFLNFR